MSANPNPESSQLHSNSSAEVPKAKKDQNESHTENMASFSLSDTAPNIHQDQTQLSQPKKSRKATKKVFSPQKPILRQQMRKHQTYSDTDDGGIFKEAPTQTQERKQALKLLKLAADQLDQLDPQEALNILETVEKNFIEQDQKTSDIWAQWKYVNITAKVMMDADLEKYKQEYSNLMNTVKNQKGFLGGRSQTQDMLQIVKNTILKHNVQDFSTDQDTQEEQMKVFPYFMLICPGHDINQQQTPPKKFMRFGLAKKQINILDFLLTKKKDFYCLRQFQISSELRKSETFNAKHFTHIIISSSQFQIQPSINLFSKTLKNLVFVIGNPEQLFLESLIKSQWPRLQDVIFVGPISQKFCQYIAKGRWPELKKLSLMGTGISDQGCKHLAKAKWPKLQQLNLSNNLISNLGCRYLTKGEWPELVKLNLDDNEITQEGIKHLRKAAWSKLQNLCLGDNDIGIQGGKNLSKGYFKKLEHLRVQDQNITFETQKKLLLGNWSTNVNIECQKRTKNSGFVEFVMAMSNPQFREWFNQAQDQNERIRQLLNEKFPGQ